MSNLLSAQFSRLFKSKLFYAAVILLFLSGAVADFGNIGNIAFNAQLFSQTENIDIPKNLYNMSMEVDILCYYDFYIFIIIAAVFIGLFIGRDFEDNTIRNKIIIGSSRTAVYLSNLIVCVSAQIIMHLTFCLTVFIPSIIAYFKYKSSTYELTFFANSVGTFFLCELIGFGIILVSSSLYLFFTMVSASRTRSIIASMIALFAMILLAEQAQGIIYNPEEPSQPYDFSYSFAETEDSALPDDDLLTEYDSYADFMESSRGRNVSKIDMLIYGTLDNILPTSQAMYLSNSDSVPPRTLQYLISDFGLSAVLNIAGIILFLRKELR